MPGKLYLVGTPIGNLEDISFRALRVLKEVDLILAEDTRRTRGLLTHFDIHTSLSSCHEHNERDMAPKAVTWLQEGQNLALVTDAGLPGISDPGEYLVKQALEGGIAVEAVPGPSAFVLALVVSGLSAEHFTFWGFPPRRGKERREFFMNALSRRETAIFYEAPTRLVDTLDDLAAMAPERQASVARELTKVYEEVQRGSLTELASRFRRREVRGEVCLVVSGRPPEEEELFLPEHPLPDPVSLVAELETNGFERKQAMREAAKRLGLSRREIYRRIVAEKQEQDTDTIK